MVGLARAGLIFGNVWWMYGGYAWLTNSVPPTRTRLKLVLLMGMAGFMLVALATPRAFGSSGLAFGIGYMVVTLVHTFMFLLSTEAKPVQAMMRLGPFNIVTASLLLAAAFTGGALQWGLWTAAFALHWITPLFTAVAGFGIRAGHFVERHGLILLIALGEEIIAIGIGLQSRTLGFGLALTALLALALGASLWWMYFERDQADAERALSSAAPERIAWLSLSAFGYAFLPILGGIVLLAAGIKLATISPASASVTIGLFAAAGAAVYLVGLWLFRGMLGVGYPPVRLLAAGLALLSAPLGMFVSIAPQLAVLVVVMAGTSMVESRRR